MKYLSKILLITILLCLQTSAAFAQIDEDFFEKYRGEGGLYRLLMPKGNTTETKTFRIDKDIEVFSTEVKFVKDDRPIHNSQKTFKVRLDQTIGPPIKEDDLPELLDAEVKRITESYKKQLGYLNKEDRQMFGRNPGVEIVIIYQDKDFGEQGLRTRIMFSDYSRLEISFSGPKSALFSSQVDKFFDSLEFFNGRIKSSGDFEKDWKPYNTASDVYTLYLPPVTPPYYERDPLVQSGSRVELMNTGIQDPVLGSQMFYNVYTYKFNGPINSNNAKKVIYQRHMQKFDVDPRRVKYLNKIDAEENEFFETNAKIFSPPGYEYLDRIRLRGRVYDNILVVQELIGPAILTNTTFADTLFDLLKFHPKGSGAGAVTKKDAIPDFITSPTMPKEKKAEESLQEILNPPKEDDSKKR
ncbi:MAG: hypothetical protein LRY54_02745 [Alphaproteobacteria bacterium]|nr:hypothetical protein [Alphaproteobacteria bacterium]